MKLAIVGSREYPNEEQVRALVRSLPLDWEIVSGGCDGVDAWAESEAKLRGMKVTAFRVPETAWRANRGAAFMRNGHVAAYCEALVAFPHGLARGTMDTVVKAVTLGRPIFVVAPDDPLPTVDQIARRRE